MDLSELRAARPLPEETSPKTLDLGADMPQIPMRVSQCSLLDRFTSWLGNYNPFSSPVNGAKHTVWLQDNVAGRSVNPLIWEAEFVAAYFIKNTGKVSSKVIADIAEKLGLAKGDAAEATIADRLGPWVEAILPAHTVKINIGGVYEEALGPSDRSGVSINTIRTKGAHEDGSTVTSHAVDISAHPMTTTFAEPTGWAVISDIDDTIKVTMTADPLGIIRSTFVDDPTPVAGMPELYNYFRMVLQNPPFWYLSASPYNLYPFLREFRETHYPAGPLLLRESSWMNLAGFLTSLTVGVQAYKVRRMKTVLDQFPKRKFVCVGDSTQSDPEAYGQIAYRFPNRIKAIFIRKVTGVAEVDEAKKNAPARFEKAFEGLPSDLWHVFEGPEELYGRVRALRDQELEDMAAGEQVERQSAIAVERSNPITLKFGKDLDAAPHRDAKDFDEMFHRT